MPVCPNCSAEATEGSLFCPQCGSPLPPTHEPVEADAPPAPPAESHSPEDGSPEGGSPDEEPQPPAHAVDDDPDEFEQPGPPATEQPASEPVPGEGQSADAGMPVEPTPPTESTPPTKPMRGRRLTMVAKVGLVLAMLIGLANIVLALFNMFDGRGLGEIDDWFDTMSDNLPIISAAMLGQIFLGILAGVLCFFKRAWIHPLVFIVLLVAAQFARGIPGDELVWSDTVWSEPSSLQDFTTWSQIWFWLPSMMILAMLIYWLGWKLGKPKPAAQS